MSMCILIHTRVCENTYTHAHTQSAEKLPALAATQPLGTRPQGWGSPCTPLSTPALPCLAGWRALIQMPNS